MHSSVNKNNMVKASNDKPTRLKRKDTREELLPSKKIAIDPVEAYRKIIEEEKLEALSRDEIKDFELYVDKCNQIRNGVMFIAENKNSDFDLEKPAIREKRVKTSISVMQMKILNRMEKIRLNEIRGTIINAREKSDIEHLQYQNLLYEILYLKKEINRCNSYKVKEKDIEIITEEELYAQAPEAVSRKRTSSISDQHKLKLARLEWELKKRKDLTKLSQDLHEEKKKIKSDIVNRKMRNDGLAPLIDAALHVMKPIQDQLGLLPYITQKQPELASLLPHPLYHLCVQIEGLREAYDHHLKVEITGDKDEAISCNTMEESIDEDSDSDSEDSNEGVEDEELHHKRKSRKEIREEKKKLLLTKHPLAIELTVSAKGMEESIKVVFMYLTNLRLVTVFAYINGITDTPGACVMYLTEKTILLDDLIPGDLGDTCPNPANQFQLKKFGINFDRNELGTPYIWAQKVCGNVFNQTLKDDDFLASLVSVISSIRKRLQHRVKLCAQMVDLELSVMPVFKGSMVFGRAVSKSKLEKWNMLSLMDYEEMFPSNVLSPNDFYYLATISNDSATLLVGIVIGNNYPTTEACYSLKVKIDSETLDSSNNVHIREMERELNVYSNEHTIKDKCWLLSSQLGLLLVQFDVFLECLYPEKFPKQQLYNHPFKGRNRQLPLKFEKIGENRYDFVHR